MDNTQKSDTKEALVCNVLLAACMVLGFVTGLYSLFVTVYVPAFLAYSFIRLRASSNIISIIIVAMVSSVFMKRFDFVILALTLPAGALVAFSVRKRKGLLHSVSCCVFGFLVSALLIAVALSSVKSGGSEAILRLGEAWQSLRLSFDAVMEAYQITPEQKVAYYNMFSAIAPSFVIIALTVNAYAVVWICLRALFRKDKSYMSSYRPFSCIRANAICVIAAAICFIMSMFAGEMVSKALMNVVIVIGFFMFVCGISVVYFFAERLPALTARVIVYILLYTAAFAASSLFMFIGIIDVFINVRRLR